jgi:hypothetical protein
MIDTRKCEACGQPLKRHRSGADHRRLFALMSAAYMHWPERHKFQPSSAEHLRAWLTIHAGHYDVVTVPVPEDAPEIVVRLAALGAEAAIKAASTFAWPVAKGHQIDVYSPRSIAWDKLSQKDFAPIRQRIEDVIAAEIGIDAETLLREHQRAA